MKSPFPFRLRAALGAAALLAGPLWAGAPRARQVLSFDRDWRFLQADAAGAEAPDFDDSTWRPVDVPHDWSIAGPFNRDNPAGGAGGFLPAGIGWYRRRFALPAGAGDRRFFVEFDGVMANSDVWLNGRLLGHRPSGSASFRYELTGLLRFGAESNLLAVRADNARQPASRWYEGAGIYRHVRLISTAAVHLEPWGTIVTTPQVSADRAVVHLHATVVNQSAAARGVALRIELHGPDGLAVAGATPAAQMIPAGQSAEFDQDLIVAHPRRWGVERPALYRALTSVISRFTTLDDETTSFGIREFHFDADTGFWLNGENLKLKGVCLHEDASALGAAVPLGAWERRLVALRQLGVNAIRTAHNPPAPEFLDLCDRLGFLVMDEAFDCWTVAKNPYDYHLYFDAWSKTDARDLVRRDRNHPSIVLWSAGNEIHDTPQPEKAKAILAGLVAVFHANDPTRPVTQALFRPNVSHDYDDGLADLLDVVGTNYRFNELLAAHEAKPSRRIVGTENGHELPSWLAVRDNPDYAGEFIWSGIDYLGESRGWPTIASAAGLLDRTGRPHPDGAIFQSWWSAQPMVYVARRAAPTPPRPTDPGYETDAVARRRRQVLFADWNPAELGPHLENVEVDSNCERVELFLNGRSLGAQPQSSDLAPRMWKVPFAPGVLRAVGTRGGQPAAVQELRTAGAPARLALAADRSRLGLAWDEVGYVSATVVDANGIVVPDARNQVVFQIAGPGVIAAVDSADNASTEPFQATRRHAYQGRCCAIVKATDSSGDIVVSASAEGLPGASVTLAAMPGSSVVP